MYILSARPGRGGMGPVYGLGKATVPPPPHRLGIYPIPLLEGVGGAETLKEQVLKC